MSSTMLSVQIDARLIRSDTSVGLANENVDIQYKQHTDSVYIDAGTFPTSSTGHALVTVNMTAGVLYDLKAIFDGDTILMFTASQGTATFDPVKGTQTVVTVRASTTQVGNVFTANVTGSLKTGTGAGIVGETLNVLVDNSQAGTTTTLAGGAFSFQVPDISLGRHTIKVDYPGSSIYLQSAAITELIVGLLKSNWPLVGAAVIGAVTILGVGTYVARSKRFGGRRRSKKR